MADFSNPTVTNPTLHGPYAALANHPAYYSLYALYHDYPVSNVWFQEPEHAARLKKSLRTIAPLLELISPYRKSYALRLFTERESLLRFPPDKANEAWRQLRHMIELIGTPAGWEERGKEPEEDGRREEVEAAEEGEEGTEAGDGPPGKKVRAAARRGRAAPTETSETAENAGEAEAEALPAEEEPSQSKRVFPKSPVDYDMEV